MAGPFANRFAATLARADGAKLLLKHLGRALAVDEATAGPAAKRVAEAAQAAGVQLLLMLPAPDGNGTTAVVREHKKSGDRFLLIRTGEEGATIFEADEIDPSLLSLARASVEIFGLNEADAAIREPLAQARR